jgi:carbamoyltransferase
MSQRFGVYGPSHPWLGNTGYRLAYPMIKAAAAKKQFYTADSQYAQERGSSLRMKLQQGETLYLLGIGSGSHNSGVALVEVSPTNGVCLLSNHEEERFVAVKHCSSYPKSAIEALRVQMAQRGIEPTDIHACLGTFDYPQCIAYSLQSFFQEFPSSLSILRSVLSSQKQASQSLIDTSALFETPRQLGLQLGLGKPLPIIGMNHHDSHAYFSYAASPFYHDSASVMVIVIDGFGDDGSLSLYIGKQGQLKRIYNNQSMMDSIGFLYSYLSSTQGGWPVLSSEGRYMGAAAWGNTNRLTNPYYLRLRQLVYFGPEGEIRLNRALANWPRRGLDAPYTSALIDIIGPPIPQQAMWNPDAILQVEDIKHAETTQERVDKAAAVQLVFEDILFHIVGHFIRTTGSHKLIFTGGCALNCLANMRLLEHFNEAYYEQYHHQKNTRLHLWIPPTPNDTGVTMGAAYSFALQHGAVADRPLQHAFYCGLAPTSTLIREAIDAEEDIAYTELGNVRDTFYCNRVASLMAYIVAHDGIVGLFQGCAETGPRALGHRSILANPCNPHTRENLNKLVKFRELIRPLAPMLTYEAAHRWFELSEGASDDQYNAYNYMVLTAPARPESYAVIPAVIHKDGTGRLQIVRRDTDPFVHTYLKAMGERVGVEVSVNTSLNVGSPIVQTPAQALQALKRSKGMHGLFLIGDDGEAFLAWHNIQAPPKDAGAQLRAWRYAWQEETSETEHATSDDVSIEEM